MAHIFLSAGEPSGVAIAAALMRAVRRRLPDVRFTGIGGPEMVEEGLRQITDVQKSAAMWLFGNLSRIPEHRRTLEACERAWEKDRPDLVITVDYQAFHLFLGTRAQARDLRVLHFVGSQFWGRTYWTLEPSRRAYSHVLLIHEFEKRFYDEKGIPATYVGHPVFERLGTRELNQDLVGSLRDGEEPLLGILPGSRGTEVKSALPVMLEAAARITPPPRVVVSSAHDGLRPMVQKLIEEGPVQARVLDRSSGEILSAARAALITSGSTTMEAVYYGCPALALYKLHPLSFFFAKPHVASSIAQPNILMSRPVMPEFLMGRRKPALVAEAATRLLYDEAHRDKQRQDFRTLRERLLKGPTPSEAAAETVLRLLQG